MKKIMLFKDFINESILPNQISNPDIEGFVKDLPKIFKDVVRRESVIQYAKNFMELVKQEYYPEKQQTLKRNPEQNTLFYIGELEDKLDAGKVGDSKFNKEVNRYILSDSDIEDTFNEFAVNFITFVYDIEW